MKGKFFLTEKIACSRTWRQERARYVGGTQGRCAGSSVTEALRRLRHKEVRGLAQDTVSLLCLLFAG